MNNRKALTLILGRCALAKTYYKANCIKLQDCPLQISFMMQEKQARTVYFLWFFVFPRQAQFLLL